MAQQENSNSFALLVDEEVDDVSTLLDHLAEKVKTSLAEEEKRQKQIQSGSENGERSRGRGDQGYGSGRFGHANRYEQNNRGSNGHHRNYREGNGYVGSNSYQRNYGGANGYQRNYQRNYGGEYVNQHNNGGEDGYQHNNGGEDGYQHNYGGENGNRRSYGGMNGNQRNYRGDSNYGGNPARNAGYHNGNGHGKGSGSDENVSGNEVKALDSQQNPIQDVANGSGREQVNEVQRNGRSGSDRRVYGGGNSNFRGREGNYYGGRSGSNSSGVEKEHAISGDNSGKAERNPPLPTDVDKDAKPKQGKHENDDSSEKAREREEKAREREERAREREERAREREEEEKKLTLGQYEKQLCEKRKALEAMKNSAERIVNVDKDFESMKLVEKKKEDSLFIKLDSEKDKPKKKDIIDKEEKVRKSVSIHEFLKPVGRGRGGRGRGRGEQGGFRGSFPRQQGRGDATPALEDVPSPTLEYTDAHQFPILGGAVKK